MKTCVHLCLMRNITENWFVQFNVLVFCFFLFLSPTQIATILKNRIHFECFDYFNRNLFMNNCNAFGHINWLRTHIQPIYYEFYGQ